MKAWECPRCNKINAPWLNQCYCGPLTVPRTDPPAPPQTELGWSPITGYGTGSFELRMDDDEK